LTPEGTALFKQSSTDDKNTFLDSMIAKLAELIPIDSSRITTSRRNQPDPNASDQILFQVTFKPTEDLSQKTGQQIIDDLDDLIRNKAYNSFSQEHPTIYLDETYGFSPIGMQLCSLSYVTIAWNAIMNELIQFMKLVYI